MLYWVTYVCLAVFVIAVVYRGIKIQRLPIHLRWELYPVAHEGKKACYGGSYMEESDWWTRPRETSLLSELRGMLPEMIFIKALFEHNRKLWFRSFPFHFGLYLLAGLIGLLGLGAIAELVGFKVHHGTGLAGLLELATMVVGYTGLVLASFGAAALLHRRLTDEQLKNYTSPADVGNLVFILGTLLVTLLTVLIADPRFNGLRDYVQGVLTFRPLPVGSSLLGLAILLASLLLAYIPLTHMSHFFTKWFMWHKVRWDDQPLEKGSKEEAVLQGYLKFPVSWAQPILEADGKKNWAEICTEEIKK